MYLPGPLGVWFLQLPGHMIKEIGKEHDIHVMDLNDPYEFSHRLTQKYDCMTVTRLMAKELVRYLTS